MNTNIPAVVLGAGINGLGVARSLSRAGVPVCLLDVDDRRPEMHTRVARRLRIEALDGDDLVRELVRLGTERFRDLRPVLLLTREESVRTVSEHREQLAPLYRFTLPPRDLVQALLNKHGFQCMAEKHGAPIPPLVRIRSVSDMESLGNLCFPVVIKPGERNARYARHFKKAYRVETLDQALDLVDRMLPVMADVVAQEWTEGPDSSLYFCLQYLDRRGRATASFTGRKVRSWPPQVGGTASCVPAAGAHRRLSHLTTEFFRACGVVGMAAMEYKYDMHRSEFRMVEPTIGRTDYQAEVATLNGVNLPHAAWCAELDTEFPAPASPGRALAWRMKEEDLKSALAQQQSSGWGLEGLAVVDAMWRGSDPMPYLVGRLHHLRRALGNRAARMVPRTRATGGHP